MFRWAFLGFAPGTVGDVDLQRIRNYGKANGLAQQIIALRSHLLLSAVLALRRLSSSSVACPAKGRPLANEARVVGSRNSMASATSAGAVRFQAGITHARTAHAGPDLVK